MIHQQPHGIGTQHLRAEPVDHTPMDCHSLGWTPEWPLGHFGILMGGPHGSVWQSWADGPGLVCGINASIPTCPPNRHKAKVKSLEFLSWGRLDAEELMLFSGFHVESPERCDILSETAQAFCFMVASSIIITKKRILQLQKINSTMGKILLSASSDITEMKSTPFPCLEFYTWG